MISPSMMCANPLELAKTLDVFEKKGVEYLHIDIMDGVFVPNFTLGPDYCKALRGGCNIPLDIHLMVEKPEDKLSFFELKKGDIVSVHAESTNHLQRVIRNIKDSGAQAFVAINPATPLCSIEEVLCDVDGVLIMTVNPGFAGQKMIPQTLDKIKRLRAMTDKPIEVDGNVSYENAYLMKKSGADIFVLGTASIFSKTDSLENGIDKIREVIK